MTAIETGLALLLLCVLFCAVVVPELKHRSRSAEFGRAQRLSSIYIAWRLAILDNASTTNESVSIATLASYLTGEPSVRMGFRSAGDVNTLAAEMAADYTFSQQMLTGKFVPADEILVVDKAKLSGAEGSMALLGNGTIVILDTAGADPLRSTGQGYSSVKYIDP